MRRTATFGSPSVVHVKAVTTESRKTALNAHVKRRDTLNRTRDFPCPFCSSQFYEKSDLNVHIQSHVKEKRFLFHHCNFKTHSSASLRCHIYDVDERIIFICSFPGCNFRADWKQRLKKHLKMHNPDPLVRHPFTCTFAGCQYCATNRQCLDAQIDTRHNLNRVRKFPCPLCRQTFYTRSGAHMHVKVAHLKEKGYKCDKYSYTSVRPYPLKMQHGRMHHGTDVAPSGFICGSCGFRALSKGKLSFHIRRAQVQQGEFKRSFDTSELEKECYRKCPLVLLNRIHSQVL